MLPRTLIANTANMKIATTSAWYLRSFYIAAFLLMVPTLVACSTAQNNWKDASPVSLSPPEIQAEFRAVWVATVANIDWPSKPGLTAAEQRRQATDILDQAQSLNLNAIVLQIRPHADALYPSKLEPWSSYLSGTQGQNPGYDPLQFWLDEAHARGLELHAWFNPFRAAHPADASELSSNHIAVTRPDLVRQVGDYLWLDPAEPEARAHSLAVVADVMKRYDLDGVHLDDYFYPYPSEESPFPDNEGYQAYINAGGDANLNTWRRSHINTFVKELATLVREHSPTARVGISPFGIWRPGHPEGIVGFDAYDGLAADARLWVQAGWLDYVTPQLYWPIESEGQPFEPLLQWWQSTDMRNRGVWPGLYLTRIKEDSGWAPEAIVQQIQVARKNNAGGFILFSMIGLSENRQQVADTLSDTVLGEPAVVPEPWFGVRSPREPQPIVRIKQTGDGLRIHWQAQPGARQPFRWFVSTRSGNGWASAAFPGHANSLDIRVDPSDPLTKPDAVLLTPVHRFGAVGRSAAVVRLSP